MKLALYIGTRTPWYVGLGNRLVRLRLRSSVSHCELVFEPGDAVADLMPAARPRLTPAARCGAPAAAPPTRSLPGASAAPASRAAYA